MHLENTLPGKPYPLGTEVSADGVNFAVFSRNGTRVILDLFQNPQDNEPYAAIELDPVNNRTGDIWHVFIPGLRAGAWLIAVLVFIFFPEFYEMIGNSGGFTKGLLA